MELGRGVSVKKDSERRVLRRGSVKGVSRRCLERPLGEYDPLGVRPREMQCIRTLIVFSCFFLFFVFLPCIYRLQGIPFPQFSKDMGGSLGKKSLVLA